MATNQKNAIIKTKIESIIYELLVKTSAENVYLDDTTTLAAKLAEIITTLNNKANSTDVTAEIGAAISGLINGAPATYDTLKEISDYISAHEDVVTALNTAIGNKVSKEDGKGLSANDFTNALKTKLDGIAAGAEVNQNAFSNVTVGSTTIAAGAKKDTIKFVAGSNITLTPDSANKQVTISATVPTLDDASQSVSGLMSADDKKKLDGIENGANKTTVDTAMSSTSTNPVQNKVVKSAIDAKPNIYVQSSQPSSLKANDVWIQLV